MKLDSEEQRETLLQLLESITVQVTLGNAATVPEQVAGILDPIRNAEIEKAPRRKRNDKA